MSCHIIFLQNLPKDIHIIVPDLPGHGETTIPSPEDKIDLPTLADRLYEVSLFYIVFLCYT